MNNKQRKSLIVALIFFMGLVLWSASNAQTWQGIDEGLKGYESEEGIWIFKINQDNNKFFVRGSNLNPKGLPQWAEYASGGTNLNMFKGGYLPNGYTKLNGKIIQPEIINYNSFIVWNNDTLRIMDRTKESMEEILSYPNVSQNIRMVSESGKRNRWQVDAKKWSVSVLATTTDGDVLMIHSRKPYTMHQFINILLAKEELNIYRMVYLEGGPESGIVMYGNFSRPLRKGQKLERMGSYETGFNENDNNTVFWGIPWALCFKLK